MNLLDSALHYALIGWYVFPIGEDSKKPITPHGHRNATRDQDKITSWWTANPTARIGIWCRASGFITVDVDGDDGTKKLAELESKYGTLPKSLLQRSNSGGLHILLRDPHYDINRNIYNTVSDIVGNLGGAGVIDIKCNGYIVVEPSGKYEWQSPNPFDFNQPPIPPDVPDTWLPLLLKTPEITSEPPPVMSGELAKRVAQGRLYLERYLTRGTPLAPLIQDVLNGGGGENCQTGNMRIGRIAYLIGTEAPEIGGDACLEIIRGALDQIGHSRNKLEARALASYDIGASGAPVAPTVEPQIAEPKSLLGNSLPQPGSWEYDLAEALSDVRNSLGETVQKTRNALFSLNAQSLLEKHIPATNWLVHGLIRSGGILQIAGEPKTTKTWIGTEIAYCVATGQPVFKEFGTKKGTVAYFFAEDFEADIQSHLKALAANRHISGIENLYLQPRGEFLDVLKDEDLALIVASCRAIGNVDLLILDPLRDIHSGEEDKSDSMGPVMKRLKLLGLILGCTVGVVHHMGKSSIDSGKRRQGQKSRGSGAIHGSTDTGLYLYDLKGDGETVFTNSVQSEIKGSRSAGHFELTLTITDDSNGRATNAEWTYKNSATKKADAIEELAAQDADDDAKVLARVWELTEAKTPLNITGMRTAIKGVHEKRVKASLERLIPKTLRFESSFWTGSARLGSIRYPVIIPAGWEPESKPRYQDPALAGVMSKLEDD